MKITRFNSRLLTSLALVAATASAMAQVQSQPPMSRPGMQGMQQPGQGIPVQGGRPGMNVQMSQGPQGEPGGAGGESFDAHKQKELQRIEKHQAIMQAFHSCVSAAADNAAMKSCHDTVRASMPQREGNGGRQ